ncbi:MAG TPA: hypothetical protein VFJ78_09750 [Gaiellaceae bacterium]|nr:hypothetical protein [Gaiellaceae bacterium]
MKVLVMVSCVAVAAVGSGVALATSVGGSTVDTCYAKSSGTLRVVDPTVSQCRDSETRLSWAQTPPQGPKGETGATGTKGEAGDQGLPGPKGETGVIGFQGSDGPQGPAGRPGSHGYVIVWGDYVDLPPLGGRIVTVACPAGKMIVGGGYALEDADAEESMADSSIPGWRVIARGGAFGGHVTPVAVCGNPS